PIRRRRLVPPGFPVDLPCDCQALGQESSPRPFMGLDDMTSGTDLSRKLRNGDYTVSAQMIISVLAASARPRASMVHAKGSMLRPARRKHALSAPTAYAIPYAPGGPRGGDGACKA